MSRFPKPQYKILALLAGVGIAIFLYLFNPFGVEKTPAVILAVAGLMVTWWVTEALPLPVVALLPLVLFPVLKITPLDTVVQPYADKVIFLFMGGFMLGLAIEKWNLHRRIALNIVRLTGTSGNRIILGFILATGLLSMWLSNTATTMMMFPIALSVIQVMHEGETGKGKVTNFAIALMLSIAYAANIGGISTIIGTPPNVAYVGYIEKKYEFSIGFVNWLILCAPLAIILLVTLYLVLVKFLYPNGILSDRGTRQMIQEEIRKLGPLSVNEKRVMMIFLFTAFLWITRDIINRSQDLLKLDDSIIAITGAVLLFMCPAKGTKNHAILEWEDTKKMAWGILLLFGGGLSLASTMEDAGLIQQLGQWMGQFSQNEFLLVLAITFISLFISELLSNIAQVIVFAPVVSTLADSLGMNPLMLGLPMTLAASCASMLPMGTPPNAIVFASGHIKLRHMTRAGLVMNLVAVVLITLFCWYLVPLLLIS